MLTWNVQQPVQSGSKQCYLICLQEFADWIASQDNTFETPYAIEQDKVAGMSIRLQFNSDTKWTKALKHMLANLQYCLTWMITKRQTDLPTAPQGPAG